MDHPPVLALLQRPDVKHRPDGLLQAGRQLLFLGQVFSLDYPDAYSEGLGLVLADPPLCALSRYGVLLRQAFEAGLDVDREQRAWARFVQQTRSRYLEPNLMRSGAADHWLWQPLARHRSPTINYGNHHDALVVRLTWALERTGEVLEANKRPLHIDALCPLPEYVACVNPHHFYVAHEHKRPGGGEWLRRRVVDGAPRRLHHWHYDDESKLVLCNDCNGELSPELQFRYQRGKLSQRQTPWAHCPSCYQRRRMQPPGETPIRDLELQQMAARWAVERGLHLGPHADEGRASEPEIDRSDPDWWKKYDI